MNEALSFIKENTKHGLHIPTAALAVSGINNQPLEYRTFPGAIIAFKSRMTTMDLVNTVEALNNCAVELLDVLMRLTGRCDGCVEDCVFDEDDNFGYVYVPDYLREQAGIPAGAKVTAMPDQDTGTVTVMQADYAHDLTDVPPELMDVLRDMGVCLETLEGLLREEEIVYGGE